MFDDFLRWFGIISLTILIITILLVGRRMIKGRGFIQEAKAGKIENEARDAWNRGQTYFTAILNYPKIRFGFTGAVTDWSLMLTSITSVGWVLDQWAVTDDKFGRPQAMPVFKRPE